MLIKNEYHLYLEYHVDWDWIPPHLKIISIDSEYHLRWKIITFVSEYHLCVNIVSIAREYHLTWNIVLVTAHDERWLNLKTNGSSLWFSCRLDRSSHSVRSRRRPGLTWPSGRAAGRRRAGGWAAVLGTWVPAPPGFSHPPQTGSCLINKLRWNNCF